MSKKPPAKSILATRSAWTFDGIEEKFEEHIKHSVPQYKEAQKIVANLSSFFLSGDALFYDLGTATGALMREVLAYNAGEGIRGIGIDCVQSMAEHAMKITEDRRARFIVGDLADIELEECNMVLSYYTMQFIHPKMRQAVINKIYESLHYGGGFFLFEKVRGSDARFQDYASQFYVDFKIDAGFSESEIVNKTRSLKGVLEPFSAAGNLGLLQRAGFVDIECIFKWVCFQGWLCIK